MSVADRSMSPPPLYAASASGDRKEVSKLLKRGVDIEAVGAREEYTSLMAACANGYHEMAEILLDAGANVNAVAKGDGYTALHLAVQNGWFGVVELLMAHGADSTLQNKDGATAKDLAQSGMEGYSMRQALENVQGVNVTPMKGEQGLTRVPRLISRNRSIRRSLQL
eukprot:m.78866 g.78866  ORF g.78866 m.78866 type:complete len:167 (+) comp10756_c0_seq1:306-806(+)